MGTPTGNPPGRPLLKPSRRRWSICIAAINRILKQPTASAVTVLRCAEILLAIHQIPFESGVDKRNKRVVKELVCEANLEDALKRQVDMEQAAEKAQEQAADEARELASQKAVFNAVLGNGDGDAEAN
jgi:hypothetical protein